jgi:signal recognition particle receptor subunit beta
MPPQVWDVCSQDKIRPLWRHYFEGTTGIIYVVDAAAPERLPSARDELEVNVLSSALLDGVPLLVLANKQDLRGALSPDEVATRLGLDTATHPGREWHVQGTSALRPEGEPDGLVEGFAWLAAAAQRRRLKG